MILKKTAFALMIFFLFFSACSGNNEIKTIRDRGEICIGVNADVPRFGWLNLANSELEGMEIDLGRMMAKDILDDENAVKFLIVGGAQTRAAMLENGEIDMAIATFSITEERKKSFNFSRPYFTDEVGFLVRSDSNINNPQDMDGKTAGVVRAATAKDAFENECQKLNIYANIFEYPNYPEIKEALVKDKIDIFVADKSIIYGYIEEGFELLDYGFSSQEYGIATKFANKKLAARADALLDRMEKNGDLSAILKKWSLSK